MSVGADSNGFDEFRFIAEIFAPLAANAPGADGLRDDAALIAANGGDLIVTKDVLVAGVHFLESDPLDLVARKALRVNISDLTAKGARAEGYFLGLVWPRATRRADVELFASGLATDQAEYAMALFGGDTTRQGRDGAPFTVSVTLFGRAGARGPIRRSGARPGDLVFATGVIGDAGLGLEAAREGLSALPAARRAALESAYRLPQPPAVFADALAAHATAALDISDGLAADAGRLAAASDVQVEIRADDIPVSNAAGAWLDAQPVREAALIRLATAGDDYQVLFTAPEAVAAELVAAGAERGVRVTPVGRCTAGAGVRIVNRSGARLRIDRAGFTH